MASDSSGSSSSSNSSSPVVVTTPENAILDQIAQYASSLAPQMQDWANGAYQQTSQVTDEAVGNFLAASQKMTGLAGGMIDQYNSLFAPENAQLVADANSYASPERMAVDMGMAGATQAQAGDQAIKNSEQNLLSYGIDPSAGRYAALDKAAAVQNAANVAGAENTQRMADINTGQQLRAEAVQTGSLLPAAISNAENTAIQANAGAANASQANANTGANLMQLADKYLNTAMGLKLSPTGQVSSGVSSSQNSSHSGGGGGGGSDGGGGGGYGGGGGGSGYHMPDNTSAMGNDGGTTYGGGAQPDALTLNTGWGGDSSSGGGGGDWGSTGGSTLDLSGANDGSGGGSMQDLSGGDGSGFADGGPVPNEASPSGGALTDDVPAQMPSGGPARLNAREFVVPQDVSDWKGQEFFHNLIAQSRTKRAQMQAAMHVGPKAVPVR